MTPAAGPRRPRRRPAGSVVTRAPAPAAGAARVSPGP